jgi:polysaccharide pyruvyl transferase CsaB
MGGNHPSRVSLSGYYGCGNAGDEAVLMGIRDAFARLSGDKTELTALSQNPEETQGLHGIRAAYRMDLRTLKAEISNSQLLVSGGGSLLQDTTSLKSLLYYLYVMRVAKAKRVPFMVYAQGMGPFNRPIARKLTALTLRHSAAITVRDDESRQLLQDIGLKTPQVLVTADPAFALNPAPAAAAHAAFEHSGIEAADNMIAVALRTWGANPASLAVEYARYCDAISARYTPVLVPMHHPDDVAFSQLVHDASQCKPKILSKRMPPHEVLACIAQFKAVAAMRLHTLIFAARCGLPAIAFAYDPKVTSLMKGLNASQFTQPWSGFSPESAAELTEHAIEHNRATGYALKASADREALALKNCEIALGLLKLPYLPNSL